MATRGRPVQNGCVQGWMLFRECFVCASFTRARAAGEKYEEAFKSVQRDWQQFFEAGATESTPVRASELKYKKLSVWIIKRILHKVMPEDAAQVLRCAFVTPEDAPVYSGQSTVLFGRFGRHPRYMHPTYRRPRQDGIRFICTKN